MNIRKTLAIVAFLIAALTVAIGFRNDSTGTLFGPIFAADDETPGVDNATSADAEIESANISDEATQEEAGDTRRAVVLVADSVSTLDPYKMIGNHPDGSVALHIWDTLVRLNQDLEVEPSVAESWRLVNNFTWEFTLREGLTFHNGEAVSAEAVRFSIERAASLPGSLETFAADVDLQSVEVVDDLTVRIVTNQPISNLPYQTAFLEILPPQYYSENEASILETAPIGSGPYLLHDTIDDIVIELEAFSDYWQTDHQFDQIAFEAVPELDQRLTAMTNQEMAVVTDLPPMDIETWKMPGSELVPIESTQRLFIGINIEADPAFEDVRVRQALNYGIDTASIVDELLEGYGNRYGSWVNPPNNNVDLSPWPYDPAFARNLLTEAGFVNGITTTLTIPIGLYAQDTAIAQKVAQQLGEIGVTVTVEKEEWPVMAQRLLSDDRPPLFLLGLNSHQDAIEDTRNMSSGFVFNPTGWQNDDFEYTLKRAANTLSENSRQQLLNDAQVIAYEEAPWIWLWRPYDFYGVSDNLDWTPRRDGLVYLFKPTVAVEVSAP